MAPGRLGASPSGSRSGSRGSEPFAASYHADPSSPTSPSSPPRPRSWWRRRDRPALAGRARPGPGRRPGRLGPGQPGVLPAPAAPAARQMDEQPRRPEHAGRAARPRSPPPRWARCWAGCRAGCSASTTCSSWTTTRPTRRTSSTTSARTCSPWRSASASRPGVPPVDRPPRGHPPRPVHRRAVAARALPRASCAQVLDLVDPDPDRLLDAPEGCAQLGPRRARAPSTTAASSTCWPRRSSASVLNEIGGLMTLLEGHGDVTMDRAGAGRVPSAERFARVLRERRRSRPRRGPAAPAAPRPRGQAGPVRAGRAVHRRRRGAGRADGRRPLLGAARPTCPRWTRSGRPSAG